MRELLLSRDASVHGIKLASERVRAFLQHRLVRDAFFDEGFPAFREGLVEVIRLSQRVRAVRPVVFGHRQEHATESRPRSEEHTSELQSQSNLVCRLLLEKKKKKKYNIRR